MDNHWKALYLTGKYPGLNKTPDKILFIDLIQTINPKIFSDDKIILYGIDNEYEFYFSFLNKIQRDFPNEYAELLRNLGIPSLLIDIFPREKLLKDWNILLKMSSSKNKSDIDKKGTAFEIFLKTFFGAIEGISIFDLKQASDEQIDFILKNNVNRPLWGQFNSPLIMGEAKNWTAPTNTAVINTLDGKINNHENFVKLGIVVAMNGFTSEAPEQQGRKNSRHIIALITGDDISNLLNNDENSLDWLEGKIINAFK